MSQLGVLPWFTTEAELKPLSSCVSSEGGTLPRNCASRSHASSLYTGDSGIHVDTGVLARRESRLLHCAVPGCKTVYAIPDPKPVPAKTCIEAYLDCLAPSAHSEPVTDLSAEPRYICSHHPRGEVFNYLGRTEREFYSTKFGRIRQSLIDRDVRFQDHIRRVVFRVDTSAAFRHLIRPDTFPEFLPPTEEELVRLRAASEEYDRPSWCRPAWRCEGQPIALRRDVATPYPHKEWELSPALIEEWERKLRDVQKGYEWEFRQADIVLYKYIRELMRERDTATPERRIEIDQHVLNVLRTLPFHPAKPRYRDIKPIADEVTVARGFKLDAAGFKEGVDVFEQIVPNYLPTRTKARIRVNLERIKQVWFEDTKARLARFNKLKNDREALRRSPDFKKLLGATLLLNEDLTATQAGLLMGEPPTAIEKRAQRLRDALQAEEKELVA